MMFLFLFALNANSLTLNEYLAQVQSQGLDVKEARQQQEASALEGREADLSFRPSLFLNAELSKDQALPNPPLLNYDAYKSEKYSLGLTEQFAFGLQTKLSYQLTHTDYVNAAIPGVNIPLHFWDARPVLELKMPLLQNGFGRAVRAQRDLIRAQAESNGFKSSAQSLALTIQAEVAYWQLASAKQAVDVQMQALKSAQGVKDYVSHKSEMNLGEESDVVQASALVEARNLQLEQSKNDVKSAAQDFNALRFQNSSGVPDALDPIVADTVAQLPVPTTRPGSRLDVLAAEALSRLQAADARVNGERNRPTLDLYGTYALNGRDNAADSATDNITKAGRPTSIVGLRFSMPLDRSAQGDALHGARLREEAALTGYQRALFNQDKDWSDLVRKIGETESNLKLASDLEVIQTKKLAIEKNRLKQGRTTTYQVLLFEQDLLAAQLSRVRNAAQVLAFRSQMKAYQK